MACCIFSADESVKILEWQVCGEWWRVVVCELWYQIITDTFYTGWAELSWCRHSSHCDDDQLRYVIHVILGKYANYVWHLLTHLTTLIRSSISHQDITWEHHLLNICRHGQKLFQWKLAFKASTFLQLPAEFVRMRKVLIFFLRFKILLMMMLGANSSSCSCQHWFRT